MEKDANWYDEKIKDIKKRKRDLKNLQDPNMVKKIKKDLKKEQRAAKRAEKQNLKKFIDDQIDNYEE